MDFRDVVIRMRLAVGNSVDDPVALARIKILAHALSREAAKGDGEALLRQMEGLAQALEELGTQATLDELFDRVDEIIATRH